MHLPTKVNSLFAQTFMANKIILIKPYKLQNIFIKYLHFWSANVRVEELSVHCAEGVMAGK